MNWEAVFWLAAMVIFILAEASTVTLVSIWFAVGSLIAGIAAWFLWPLWLQITLFLAVSGALLALLWPFIKKFLRPKLEKTNVDAVIAYIRSYGSYAMVFSFFLMSSSLICRSLSVAYKLIEAVSFPAERKSKAIVNQSIRIETSRISTCFPR